ncbi:MAG TPA: glycoside hydrolase domain-containing protein [Niallia sp.]|nr:glycoside hydrolase domain-containing protein [Niallia sp.]
MNWKKYFLIAAATFLILLSGITTFFLLQLNNVDAEKSSTTSTSKTKTETSTEASGDVNISVTNNIQNIIRGDSEASVENKVTSDVSDKDAFIKNDIHNKAEDEVSITINNAIENLLKGNVKGTVDNNINNEILSNGKSEIVNDLLNDFALQVHVDVANEINTSSQKLDKDTKKEDSDQSKEEVKSNNSNSDKNSSNNDSKEETSYLWGIDSASETTEEFFACVRDNFGDPKIVARYLGTNDGVSAGLTKEQVETIHSNDAELLLVYNGFTDATGYDNGVNQAKEAINLANDLGVPKNVALFVDIEPTYPVDASFIQGWFDEISDSNYTPAIYGSFDSDSSLTAAYNKAVEENGAILEDTYLWSSSPNIGITQDSKAPKEYKVDAPKDSLSYGWQYGIDAETCNIDTNLFNSKLSDVLWKK